MPVPLPKLPTVQNWSCHSCGSCCREHFVHVTDEERARIENQGWAERPGFFDGSLFVQARDPAGRRRWRIAHRADGACIFLDERGLCRIHAEFGEPAKPLACQLFPYVIVPAGDELRLSVRYSCPSSVANRGRPITQQADTLRKYAKLSVPDDFRRTPPPPLRGNVRLDWPDTRRFLEALAWLRLAKDARYDKLKGERLTEFLDLLAGAAAAELDARCADEPRLGDGGSSDAATMDTRVVVSPRLGVSASPRPIRPSRIARVLFRQLVAQYARRDTSPDLRRGIGGRWFLVRSAVRFARGKGRIPRLQTMLPEAGFHEIEGDFGPLPPEAAEILDRYYHVKITGLDFFGAAYYGIPLVEGFYGLALTLPAFLWIARWLAVGDARRVLATDDLARAVSIVDHHHGYDPALGKRAARRRVRVLARSGQIERLIAWYAGK